jgi:hypothetical protein
VTSLLMRLGLQALLDRALEEERTDFVGRERYASTAAPAEEPPAQGYRNGYKPGACGHRRRSRRGGDSVGPPERGIFPAADASCRAGAQCGAGAASGRTVCSRAIDPRHQSDLPRPADGGLYPIAHGGQSDYRGSVARA